MPDIHPIALLCIATLGLLLFALGLTVSGARAKTRVLIGVTPDADHLLNRLVRAHGNTAEYAPFLALLFLVHGARHPGPLVVGFIVAATLSRIVFVVGLLTARSLSRPSPLRFLGAAGTYGCGIWLALRLITGA